MKSNWEKFIKSYKQAPSKVRELIDSEKIPELVDELVFDKYIRLNDRTDLIKTISDIVLNLSNTKELVGNLTHQKKYSEESAGKISEKIDDFLIANDLISNKNPPIPNKEEPDDRTHGYGKFRKQEPRNDENIYAPTSQDELLNKKQPDTPSYIDRNNVD